VEFYCISERVEVFFCHPKKELFKQLAGMIISAAYANTNLF